MAALRKYGSSSEGEVLKDKEEREEEKVAAANWTDKDREQLEEENKEADGD